MMFSGSNEPKSYAGAQSSLPVSAVALADLTDAVDMAVLSSLEGAQIEGEPDIVVELMELYLEDAAAKLAAMKESAAAKDGRRLARLAHSLRGSSASLGARRVTALCAELEKVDKGDASRRADELMAKLEPALACVRGVFEAECRRRA